MVGTVPKNSWSSKSNAFFMLHSRDPSSNAKIITETGLKTLGFNSNPASIPVGSLVAANLREVDLTNFVDSTSLA